MRDALLAHAISEGNSPASSTFATMIVHSISNGLFGSLHTAPLACYTLWRGRQDHNSALVDASHQLYIRGLVQAQKALMDPASARSDAALATCNALGLYEALECPGNSTAGYRWHRDACSRLVRLRGPKMHRDGFGHQLFISIRLFIVRYSTLSAFVDQDANAMYRYSKLSRKARRASSPPRNG